MPVYTLDVGSWGQPATRRLSQARDIQLTARLGSPSELSFSLDARTADAAAVIPLVSDVHLYRDGKLLYTGRVGKPTDNPAASEHRRTYATADYRAILARRPWTGAQTTWSGEQANVVKALVDAAQSADGGNLGITTTGLPTTGAAATRVTERGAMIGAELDALAGAGDETSTTTPGFDWDITPGLTSRTLQLFYPYRGALRPTLSYRWMENVLARESSRVRNLSRAADPANYANAVLLTGGIKHVTTASTYVNPTTGQTQVSTETKDVPTTPVFRALADIATRPEGLWVAVLSYTDILENTELSAKADERLAALSTFVPSYSLTLVNGTWAGPDDVWLGDRVPLRVLSGVVNDSLTLRVTEIAINPDSAGNEDVTITFGTPPFGLSELGAVLQRLATVELHP